MVAVSGGSDSVAMLRILHDMAPEQGWLVWVGHVDHQLRPDSGEHADFVRKLAAGLGLGFELAKVDCSRQHGSPEEAARKARRQALASVAERIGAGTIALAHTLDDQAETVLSRMLTGSGPTGLAAMAEWRSPWWRPLLGCTRAELRDCLRGLGQDWREDPSNADDSFLRNRVRGHLLPLAKDMINPRASQALARLAQVMALEEEYWDQWCGQQAAKGFLRQGSNLLIRSQALADLHPAQLRRLLRYAAGLVLGSGQHLLHDGLVRLEDLWEGEVGRESQPGAGLSAWREHGGLRLDLAGEPPEFSYILDGPGEVELPHLGATLRVEISQGPPKLKASGPEAWIPAEGVAWPLVVRNPVKGERIHPMGAPGSKRLSRFFIDRRVDIWWRKRSPVVSDAAGLWWVAPWTIAERARLTNGKGDFIRLCLVDTKRGGPYTW